ncbi:protocadherin-12-like isoform X1 [Labeo rohita]|uniref:Protocadherin-12-like isoform X1 n=1 Tax=Labeo rohita TaxID=84645 RepID=A0A498MWI1_LABRO|nr:LOW QUALITY PROTEIN: protocadherin-12 [Labeo rohita]RXN23814.1 protocadherin-12-like isoform X1 [Labeo rohita]
MLQVLLLLAALIECPPCQAHNVGSAPLIIQYHVWEEQPSGTKVGRLLDDLRERAETGSLENFQVVPHGHALPVTVDSRDGTVSTLRRLDREELCWEQAFCELSFSVLYRKGGAMHFLSVRVEVMDQNDHSPVFPNLVQEVEISEMASLRMRIPLDRAVDPDAGPNGLQTYSLSSNEHFALDVRTSGGTKQAELVVIKELDRELQPSLELVLTAWDKGNPPKSGSTKVIVTILDSNDNSPVFEKAPAVIELAEDTVRGTIVINLRATDPDQGANGEVEYSLSKHVPPDVQRLFSIHPKTGALTLQGPLDFEEKHVYEVDVQARDLGPNAIPSHHKLQVKLRDVNDNAPRIHITWTPPDSPVATISEGAPNETFLALVMVSDADSGANGQVQVHILSGSGSFRLKQIHGDNYMIVTNDTLDRERQMEYNLTLLAQDSGQPSLSCIKHLTVHVLDENDNAPMFTKGVYRSVLKENNTPGFQFLNVEARDVDLDLSGRVSFSIRESNELGTPTAFFSVHPSSGAVTVQQSLDYEESHSYSFIVEAVDQGYPPMTSSATVLVEIQDVNDNYPVIHEPLPKNGVALLSVPVNVDKGEIVTPLGDKALEDNNYKPRNDSSFNNPEGFLATTIRASDGDSGLNGRLSFRITDGKPSNLFFLDKTTGQLYVNTTNGTELIGRTFKLGIAVSDMGTPMLTTRITLEVTFINFRDHLKNLSNDNQAQYSFTMLLAICLGSTCLVLFLAIALAKTFCHPDKRDNRAYNCRQAESTYTRHPRRPQKHIRKTDIQLVPVLRGRKEAPQEDEAEALSCTSPLVEKPHPQGQFTLTPTLARMAQNQAHAEMDGNTPLTQSKILRKPGSIEWNGTLPYNPGTPYRTLQKPRNSSSSSFANSQTSTLRRNKNEEVKQTTMEPLETMSSVPSNQATLRRPKTTERRGKMDESDHRQILRNLVRLSMAAFAENGSIELSSASPEVQQVSQLLSLLHQGQLQPRPNFRGNKYSHRTGRSGAQDADWLSTKDSGHGESEMGDMDWDSPVDRLYEEGLNNLLTSDDVFSDIPDPAWMARLSLPLTTDYHENLFIPDGPPSPDNHCPMAGPDESTSFSTFGKTPEKAPLDGRALISEVSSLFEMLLTQKADAQSRPPADVLYRLSAAYRRSLGLDTANGGAAHTRQQGQTSYANPMP